MTELQHVRMLHRAAKEVWDIPEDEKRRTIETLIELRGEKHEPSVRLVACKTLILMESQNIANRHKELDRMDEGRNRILDLLGRSGSSQGPVVIEQGGAVVTGSGDQSESPRIPDRKDEGGKSRQAASVKRGGKPQANSSGLNSDDPGSKPGRSKKKKAT